MGEACVAPQTQGYAGLISAALISQPLTLSILPHFSSCSPGAYIGSQLQGCALTAGLLSVALSQPPTPHFHTFLPAVRVPLSDPSCTHRGASSLHGPHSVTHPPHTFTHFHTSPPAARAPISAPSFRAVHLPRGWYLRPSPPPACWATARSLRSRRCSPPPWLYCWGR